MFGRHRPWGLPTLPARAAITPAWCARILPGRRDGRRPGLPARALPPLHPRMASRAIARTPLPRSTLVSRFRAPHSCPVAVGRDVPIAPPRHRRGAWLCLVSRCRTPHSCPVAVGRDVWPPGLPARALPPLHPRDALAHYPCGAMVGRWASRLVIVHGGSPHPPPVAARHPVGT